MKKKLLLSLLVIISLFVITGCNKDMNNNESNPLTNNDYGNADNNNQNSNNNLNSDDNQTKDNNYWFINQTLTSAGGSWGASKIKLVSPNSEGIPTTIVVTDSGKTVDGLDLDGTFTIRISECSAEAVIGKFSKDRVSIKGEFCNSNGKCLLIDIS